MRTISILFLLIATLLGVVHCPAEVIVHSSTRTRNTETGERAVSKARYKCDGNKCTLLPADSHPLPVPNVEVGDALPSQQPTLAEPQGAVAQQAESRPMRSVLVKPVRGAFCVASKVRQAKPVRGLLRRIFCR